MVLAKNKLRRLMQIAGRKVLAHHPAAVPVLSEQCTPPYKALQAGLSAEQEQVVLATAYSLGKIAGNLPQYRKEISDMLLQKMQDKNLSKAAAEKLSAVAAMLEKSAEA